MEAWKLHQRGKKVLIEHVSPILELTRWAIEISRDVDDKKFRAFVQEHYKLVLLSPAETQRLNRENRSRMSADRLSQAGIQLAVRGARADK